jgi:hypothetical protein
MALTVTSSRATNADPDAELTIVADDDANGPTPVAIATLRRTRAAEHEEMWAQLFVDDVFVDVTRALRLDDDGVTVTLVARLAIPPLYFEGEVHRASVRFVRSVSRVVPRFTGMAAAPIARDPEPGVRAEADFACHFTRSRVS